MVLDLHAVRATGRLARANPVAKLAAAFVLGFGVAPAPIRSRLPWSWRRSLPPWLPVA